MFALDGSPQKPVRVLLQGLKLGLVSFRKLILLSTILGFVGLLPTIYIAVKIGNAAVQPEYMLQIYKQGHGMLIVMQLLVIVFNMYINAIMILRLDKEVHATQRTDELLFAFYKMGSLLLAFLLVLITVLIGSVIAVILGALIGALASALFGKAAAFIVMFACVFIVIIYIGVYLLFFQFAIVLDDKGPVGALNQSSTLVFHNWWRTFLTLLYLAIIVMGIMIIAILPFTVAVQHLHWLSAFASQETGKTLLVRGVIQLIYVAIFTPFLMGVLYMLYHDLKLRRTTPTAPMAVVQA